MNKSHRILDKYWLWLGLLTLVCVFSLLHPELILLAKSPMSGDPWTIKDPTVSWMAFMPSLREFRFELFEHGNILWSNLRALGQPMLGNGVQGAPMFPLTLLLIGLPDTLFWSVMPITRVILIALACFVLARRVFGLPIIVSFAFAILAGFNLNVLRWINHPWSNGMLAGLWYLIFLYEVSFRRPQSVWSHRGARLGLIVAVYSMITCGFPEAAAVAALMVVFIFGALVCANVAQFSIHWRAIIKDILICHVAGFGFSALQIFALLEYIDFTAVMSLRDNYIGATFRPDEAQSYWLSQLTLLWESDLQHRYLNFSIGLIGFVLACKGLLIWLICFRHHTATLRAVGLGFLLLMLMFVAKSFGLFAPLAWIFAHTPVLAQSHFPLYFSPLFYFGLAFFAAIGFYSFSKDLFSHTWQRLMDLLVTFAAMVCSIKLLEMSVEHFNNITRQNFWIMQERGDGAAFIWVFLGLSVILLMWQLCNFIPRVRQASASRYSLVSGLISLLLIAGIITEVSGTQRSRYANIDSASLFVPNEAKLALENALDKQSLTRHELRNNDYAGSFVGLGIATVDNGISAMLPPNTRRVRRALYNTQFGGYYPLGSERFEGAGGLVSNNFQITPPQPAMPKDWARYEPSTQEDIEFLAWDRGIEQMRDNPLVLNGALLAPEQLSQASVWIKMQGNMQSLWIAAETVSSPQLNSPNNVASKKLEWTADIPTHWLYETSYQFFIRVADNESATYQDSETQTLVVHKPYPFAQTSRSLTRSEVLAGQADVSNWQITFDANTLPRAFIASGCEVFQNEDAATEFLLRSADAQRGKIALLANGVSVQSRTNADLCDSYGAEFKAVRINKDTGSELELAVVKGPALLYLGDTFYPGWEATDVSDRSRLSIRSANLGMRAVYLPEDRDYQIEFSYRPSWLPWVYLLFLIACFATYYLLRTNSLRWFRGGEVKAREYRSRT